MGERDRARQLASEYTADGQPTEWFDVLYAAGNAVMRTVG